MLLPLHGLRFLFGFPRVSKVARKAEVEPREVWMPIQSPPHRLIALLPTTTLVHTIVKEFRLPAPFIAVGELPIAFTTRVWAPLRKEAGAGWHGFSVRQLAAKRLEAAVLGTSPRANLKP